MLISWIETTEIKKKGPRKAQFLKCGSFRQDTVLACLTLFLFKRAKPGLFLFIFVLFTLQFKWQINLKSVDAWDSNPAPQNGRRWQFHWAALNTVLLLCSNWFLSACLKGPFTLSGVHYRKDSFIRTKFHSQRHFENNFGAFQQSFLAQVIDTSIKNLFTKCHLNTVGLGL